MSIRPAVLEDIPSLMRLGADFYAVANYEAPMDVGEIPATLEHLIRSPDGLAMVMEDHADVVGAILGIIHKPVFSMALQATELGWWVAPESRGRRDAVRLISAFEEWARGRGARHTVLSSLMHLRPDALDRIYRALGYAPREMVYQKVLR